MLTKYLRRSPLRRKRAVVAAQVAACLVAMVGFAALTVDVGAIYNAKADLQRTADAAALAAAGQLAEYGSGDPIPLATAAALNITHENRVLGQTVTMNLETDLVFGRASFNNAANEYNFVATTSMPNAVKVRVRKTADSPNDSLVLYFARVFGVASTDIAAEAMAVMVPRDISIVADLSASHTDDSELCHYQLTDINLLDVWAGLPIPKGNNGVGNGIDPPPPGDPDNPNDDIGTGPGHPGNQGGNPDPGASPLGGQIGPTWGWMYYWGNNLDGDFDPAVDPGLMHFPRSQDWTNDDLVTWYQQVGYSADEINALLSAEFDDASSSSTDAWSCRVAVALGLARWDSGIPGGLWESLPPGLANNGNGNNWVGSSELTWLVDYPFDSGSWQDYIYNYVGSTSTTMYSANSDFRYRFGLKTFVNYVLERRVSHSQTPELADTPTQPMQAVKDAVDFMVTMIDGLDSDDQLSLEIYGRTAHHEVDLTQDYQAVSDRLLEMQAGHYDSWTNMGGGLERAVEELSSSRARALSHKVVILLTDGNANTDAFGNYSMQGATQYALEQAEAAAAIGARIFAVSVGADANQSIMQQIAEIGDGEHFHAEGSIEEYSQQLTDIFQRLGSKRPVELIQ